tara:strand:+ start:76 stop:819 length:744 start_codon:yes stop_codon:yes gene_type:complete
LNFLSLLKRNLIFKFKKKISIDNDNIISESLDYLFHEYGSDKANIFKFNQQPGHGYSVYYEKKLEVYKNKNLNILEIGSYAGASAAAFTKYLSKSKIYCFDVNISNFKYKSDNINVFGLDINNQKKVVKTLNKIFSEQNFTQFDLIIDDGSHNLSDILMSLKFFFKYVKKQGLYIIEDYKHPNYYKYNRNIDHLLVNQIFESLNNKKFFKSNIFSDDDQIELIKSIKIIETFKGNLKNSDISFITKA